jgi:osmotically-inducible protein OsmY
MRANGGLRRIALGLVCSAVSALPVSAQLGNILTSPKTLIDRAIEARSTVDIARDNEIIVKVNAIMVELGTIQAATEIYEQRLLVTGLFDDKAKYDSFEQKVRAVSGVKKLYWHVRFMSKEEQQAAHLLNWAEVTTIATKAQARLVGTSGVADVNYRTAADSFGTLYLLGRARSAAEATKALARAHDSPSVKKLMNYVETRS